jgi:hypothetical protein
MLEVVEGPASLDSSMKIQKEKHQGEEGALEIANIIHQVSY